MALHTVFGAGPIALSLGRQLLSAGHQVRLVSRRGTELEGALSITADATNRVETLKAANGAAAIYNCTNVPYTQWATTLPALFGTILEAAEQVQARLVLLDNLYTYYPVTGHLREDSPQAPIGGKGKLRLRLAEEHLQAHRDGKVEVAILRSSDFYGPGLTNVHLGERVWKPLASGKAIQWIGNPDALHSFAYRDDVARSLLVLGTAEGATGRIWFAPHAAARTPRALIEAAGKILGRQPKIQAIPRPMLGFLGLFMPLMRELKETFYQFDAPFTVDSASFEITFGIQPTPIDVGLPRTIENFLAKR